MGINVFGLMRLALVSMSLGGLGLAGGPGCDSNPTPHPGNDAFVTETRGDVTAPTGDDETDGLRGDCGVASDDACDLTAEPNTDVEAADQSDGDAGDVQGDAGDVQGDAGPDLEDGEGGEDGGPVDGR